jgi:hypothetical protein
VKRQDAGKQVVTRMNHWWGRIAAAVTAALVGAVLLPATAWAADPVLADGVLAKKKVGKLLALGGVGIGLLCCLVVVGAIVAGVMYFMRRNR